MSSNLFCNLNSKLILNSNSPFKSEDDNFRLRYGLYETYLVVNGIIEHPNLHWQRLLKGMETLGFNIPDHYSEAYFTEKISCLVSHNNSLDMARVRLQIFTEDKITPFSPQYLIECFEVDASIAGWKEEGIKVAVLKDFYKEINETANYKISHNKHFLLSQQVMKEQNLDDVLLVNNNRNIAESAMANIFWIKDGTIFTPPLTEGCLAGTMRAILINIIAAQDIPFEEKQMTESNLENADEIFLTNSIRKIRWVREIDGKFYGNKLINEKLKNVICWNVT